MKSYTNYIVSGVLAVAVIVLFILQFNSNSSSKEENGKNLSVLLNDSSITLPVAFVNIDSLLVNYNFTERFK